MAEPPSLETVAPVRDTFVPNWTFSQEALLTAPVPPDILRPVSQEADEPPTMIPYEPAVTGLISTPENVIKDHIPPV